MLRPRTSHLGLLTRFQAAGLARRTYPVGVGIALARARAERAWRSDPRARANALGAMELLVGRTARVADLEHLAIEHLFETFKHEELAWRLGVVTRLPVSGLEHLRPHVTAGTGVILSVVHQGHFAAHAACVARHGFPISVVVARTLYGEQPHTFAGLYRRQLFATFSSSPHVSLVDATGSYPAVRDLLRAGATVLLACDLKGSTPVEFLGRTVGVPSGTARLSLETGAPVVPLSVGPHGRLEGLHLQEALLPAEHDDPAALLQAVFDRHTPAVLAWPQGYERPRIHLREVSRDGGSPVAAEPAAQDSDDAG